MKYCTTIIQTVACLIHGQSMRIAFSASFRSLSLHTPFTGCNMVTHSLYSDSVSPTSTEPFLFCLLPPLSVLCSPSKNTTAGPCDLALGLLRCLSADYPVSSISSPHTARGWGLLLEHSAHLLLDGRVRAGTQAIPVSLTRTPP